MKATAETFPITEFYDVERELTQLGIGEALVAALSPKGIPTPTARTMMRPPMSLMAQLDPAAFNAVVAASSLVPRYAQDVDASSADELLRPSGEPSIEVADPATQAGGGAMHPTRAPERDRGVDWGQVAKEGARVARSGTFNTILRAILRTFRR